MLLAPAVTRPDAIDAVTGPCAVGVRLNDQDVPEPVKLLTVPLVTVMSEVVKEEAEIDDPKVTVTGIGDTLVAVPTVVLNVQVKLAAKAGALNSAAESVNASITDQSPAAARGCPAFNPRCVRLLRNSSFLTCFNACFPSFVMSTILSSPAHKADQRLHRFHSSDFPLVELRPLNGFPAAGIPIATGNRGKLAQFAQFRIRA